VASPVADQVHQDPTPYAGARCCNGEPKIAARSSDAIQSGESTNRGTPGERSRSLVRKPHYRKSATACRADAQAPITFEITHPFHPLRGKKFVLTTRKNNWGEDRVMYFDAQGKLRSMRACWTSVSEPDLFAQAAAGRTCFRVDDLLRLCAQIAELQGGKRR